MTDSGYEPSNELKKACAPVIEDWDYRPAGACDCSDCGYRAAEGFVKAAVAFRTVDGHPELVPWAEHHAAIDELYAAQTREDRKDVGLANAVAAYMHRRVEVEALVTAAQAMVDASLIDGLVWSVEGLRAALVPFTEHQEERPPYDRGAQEC